MKTGLLLIGLLSCSALPASASLLAYQGFDTIGALHGAADGYGWKEPYAVQNQPKAGYQIVADNLAFGTLLTSGNKAQGGDSYVGSGRRLQVTESWEAAGPFEAFEKGILSGNTTTAYIGKEGTTLWASFLYQKTSSNNPSFSFHASHIPTNGSDPQVKVVGSGGNWALQFKSETAVASSTPIALNQTALVVVKFDFLTDTSDQVTLYLNPTPGLGEPNVAGTTLTTSADLYFRSWATYPGSGTANGQWDELRVGETFADVTPVPEPAASGLLAALLALGLIRARRG